MSAGYEKALDEALSIYKKKREELAEKQELLRAVTASATAPRKVVSVTVGRAGEVIDMSFPTSAYKNMTPAELASVILKTIEDARDQALAQSAELLAPMLPPGLDAQAVVRGTADLTSVFGDEPRIRDL